MTGCPEVVVAALVQRSGHEPTAQDIGTTHTHEPSEPHEQAVHRLRRSTRPTTSTQRTGEETGPWPERRQRKLREQEIHNQASIRSGQIR